MQLLQFQGPGAEHAESLFHSALGHRCYHYPTLTFHGGIFVFM